jgi:hypothetical protein
MVEDEKYNSIQLRLLVCRGSSLRARVYRLSKHGTKDCVLVEDSLAAENPDARRLEKRWVCCGVLTPRAAVDGLPLDVVVPRRPAYPI